MKKLILILLPVLVLGGGGATFVLAQRGILKIPGITPASKLKGAAALYGDPKKGDKAQKPPKPVAKKRVTPPPALEPVEPKVDPKLGREKLAGIWNEMETIALLPITAEWKEDELAAQIAEMDEEAATKLIAAIAAKDAKRAASISQKIQKLASVVPTES
jgi:hypothetical protein